MRANRITRVSGATAALVLGLWIGQANAANDRVVKGTVHLPAGVDSLGDTVVSLEGRVGTPTPGKVVMDQKGLAFVPHVLGVVVGGSVEFLNDDSVLHNVFSDSAAKRFDLGMFGRGESRTVTFDTPGVVELRCNVHPKMHAFILVLENNFFAPADQGGNFQIGDIPPGRYKLRAWHEGLSPTETWVNLDEAKIRTVDVRLQK